MMRNAKTYELNKDTFDFPDILSRDFLSVDNYGAILTNSKTHNIIKDIILEDVENRKELSFDENTFKVKKIKYTYKNKQIVTVYIVSGVYINVFDRDINISDFIGNFEPSKTYLNNPYIVLPSFADEETNRNIVVYSDIINQLIDRPRTIVDFSNSKVPALEDKEKESDFAKDCFYFSYLNGLVELPRVFYVGDFVPAFYRESALLFLFSKITSDEYTDKMGINVAKDITDDDIKGIICSYYLFLDMMQCKVFAMSPFDGNDCFKEEWLPNGGVIKTQKLRSLTENINDFWDIIKKAVSDDFNRCYKNTTKELKIIECIGSREFQKASSLEKFLIVRNLYKKLDIKEND